MVVYKNKEIDDCKYIKLSKFGALGKAVTTQNRIIEAGKENEFDSMIDDLHPYGISEDDLNFNLANQSDWIYKTLGMKIEE